MQEAEPLQNDSQKLLTLKSSMRHKHMKYLWILISLIILMIYSFYMNHKSKTHSVTAIPVVIATSTTKDVSIYLPALGNVTPVYTVTLRSQINGYLMKVFFKEGDVVKKGQLLAQIDKRPYQALLLQYEGNLKRDTALLENAKIDLHRYQKLWKENSISQQTLVTQEALVKQYEGEIESDTGLIQSTKVNLIYCDIISPIDGRIGLRLIDPGNFIQSTDTNGIAVITTIAPMTVIFPVAEDYIPQIIPQAYAHEFIEVKAYDRQQSQLLATGTFSLKQ